MTADESQLTKIFERIPGLRAASPRRLAAYSLPVLAIVALAAALLWLQPADFAQAQDEAAGPKITAGPTITSSPAGDDTYRADETITVALTFSESVTVTGKPRLRLQVGDQKRWAGYESADGATLSFAYVVTEADRDDDGVSLKKNALDLNVGKITDADGNRARLRHGKVADQAGHKVNGAPDEPEPEPPANNEPQFTDDAAARSVNENTAAGENVGTAVTATDDDGDSLTYALTGADAGSFDFDASTGQISVRDVLDYEAKSSYTVAVSVHDGKNAAGETDASVDDTIQVTITVLNVDEAGAVALDNDDPQVGTKVTASLSDPDGGVTGEAWTWERSADGIQWTAIAGATADAYTPNSDDAGKYLRATASYDDREGPGKTAMAATAGTVAALEPPPSVSAGPAIASAPASGDTYRAGETITVTLTFSEAVTVTGKPRLRLKIGDQKRWAGYDRTGADGATLSFAHAVKPDDVDSDGVSIGRNQLKLNGGTIADADGNAANLKHPKLADQAGHKVNGAADEPEPEPTPTPTPTPEPEPQRAANNEPQFPAATASRSANENAAAGTSVGGPVTAADDDSDPLTYALTGADAGSFDLDAASGQITVKAALDYEAKASYTVSVTVHDGKDTAGETDASEDDTIAITISVLNVDESGVVSLLTENNAFEVDREITATLLDPDGGVNGETWIWQHSADGNEWTAIAAATGAAYTPTADDADHYLRATASYADGQGSGKTARAETPGKVAAVVAANPVPAEPQNTPSGPPKPQKVLLGSSPLIPRDSNGRILFKVGESFRLLFVTEKTRNAISSNIADYNGLVQGTKIGVLQSIKGELRALVSTATVDARDNTATAPANGTSYATGEGVPIYWISGLDTSGDKVTYGAKVADDYADFYDGDWDNVNGTGEQATSAEQSSAGIIKAGAQYIWTGSDADGTRNAKPLGTVSDARCGRVSDSSANPISNIDCSRNWSNSLYALSPVLTVDSEPVSPARYTVTPGNRVAAVHWTIPRWDDTLARWQYRYKAGPGEYISWRNMPGSSINSWNYTVRGLTNGTAYTIQIRAVDKRGVFGKPSEEQTVTPYALTAPEARTVPSDWGLIPEGIGPGQSFRLMFITYDRTKAESKHIDTYNSFVQAQAAQTGSLVAGVGREFRALMSTATVDARDNTVTTGRGVPIYWVGGEKVADDYADFYDGSWDKPSYGYHQSGHEKRYGLVWTGSYANGTAHGKNFASGILGSVNWGTIINPNSRIGGGFMGREELNPLYAISPVLTVAPANEAPLKQIEVGLSHACALDRSGQVTCWGDDASGQVGDWGRHRYQFQRFASISAGSFLTCGILANGSVSCWGYPERENGSHAESTNEDWTTWTARTTQTGYTGWVNTPPASMKFKPESLSVGNYHACAIQTTGELSCWGKAGSDRLVIPTVATENNNEVIKKDGSGSKITDWTMVEAGFANACGIRQGGSVVCFGRATYGRSAGPSGSGPFVDVTLGVYNGCALAADGSVECWGSEGIAVLDPLKTPPTGVSFTDIEMGTEQTYFYACGLQTDGQISCWGLSTPKQLTPLAGTWSSISVGSGSACALNRAGYLGCWGESDEGLFSPPAGVFKQTDGGHIFSCAIKTDGELVCWGVNSGQTVSETPSAGTFKQVAVGASHACAIKSDDTVACWGGRYYDTNQQLQRLSAAVAPSGTYQAISAGPDLTCAIVKASDTTEGSLHCWGATTHSRQTEPSGSFTHVAVGATHVCAIKSDMTVACWGQAVFFDREGDGTADDIHGKGHHTSTIPPSGSHQYIDISAGEGHTCALRSDKKAVCWGYHADSRQAVPGSSGSDDGFGVHNYIDIATGGLPNCAIRESDGSLSCWNNEKSQYLPDASVREMRGFQSLGAGRFHMCGINSASSLVCWGAGYVIPFPARFAPP